MKNFVKIISALILTALAFPMLGQTIFDTERIVIDASKATNNPQEVIAADLDGDGDQDLLSASSIDNKIAWYENTDGAGTFGEQKIIIEYMYSGFFYVTTADLDNDGDLDVICSGMQWLENIDGLGNFGPPQWIDGQLGDVAKVVASDLDGDGDLDLVAASESAHNLSWFENEDGLGSFGDQQILIVTATYEDFTDVSTGDLDNDGDLDIVAAHIGFDKIIWFENEDGLGGFGDVQIIYEYDNNRSPSQVHIADFDGDGDQDVLASCQWGGNNRWFENEDGLGNFGPSIVIDSLAISHGIMTSDMDDDNDLDLVVANTSDQMVVWYENLGDGAIGDKHIITANEEGAHSLALADLDGDSDLEVIVSSIISDNITWYENIDGSEDFGEKRFLYDLVNGVRSMMSGDIDGDGDKDLLCASETDGKVSWFENEDGLGHFGRQNVITSQVDNATSTRLSDMDGDNDLDVVATFYNADKVVWYENVDGLGHFGTEQMVGDLESAEEVFATDLDGDGDQDVLAVSVTLNSVVWYENTDGTGSFGPTQIIASNILMARAVYATDIDGDGDQDVLTGSQLHHKVSWFENDGAGNFSPEVVITTDATFTFDVHAADIDGDGDQDVLSASLLDDKIAWYENEDGQGSFGPQQILSIEMTGARSVIAFDVDNDGDQDVVGGASEAHKFAWFENLNGEGNFGPEQILTDSALGAQALFATDIDNDGDFDLFAASKEEDKIVWYKNLRSDPAISGICFFDENQNKIKDANEVGLLNHNITIEPDAIASYTNSQGVFRFFVDNGDYTIVAQPNDDWVLTTDSTSYTVSLQDSTIQGLHFGLRPVEETTELEPSLSSAATRCGFDVPFWLSYQNVGTTFASGYVSCQLDPLVTILTVQPMPDSVDNNTLFWNYENLPPTYSNMIAMTFEMPGVDFLGDTLTFINRTYYQDDQDVFQESGTYTYQSVVNCAYDPNDKAAIPAGVGDDNLTLFGEELEYTVRFQNTGTDTAFTVRIEDQLDMDLDWTSFRVIGTSHPYEVAMYDGGLVEFLFENILLPDSTTNEVASHGFLKYRIQPLDNLAENTEVENTADIFFDFNPPIQTNTTINTYVSVILSDTNVPTDIKLQVAPNPSKDFLNFMLENPPNSGNLNLVIHDAIGQLVKTVPINPRENTQIDISDWQAGMYFYELNYNNEEVLEVGKIIKL